MRVDGGLGQTGRHGKWLDSGLFNSRIGFTDWTKVVREREESKITPNS